MKKNVKEASDRIRKKFGDDSVVSFKGARKVIQPLPSGMLSLDIALGIGGWPRGRMIELYGKEAGGKTTVAFCTAAETQRNGETVGYIDAENALDYEYANLNKVDVENMVVVQTDTGEQALGAMEQMVQESFGLVIVDSVAALVPKAELEGEIGDSHVGLQARLMAQTLRKTSGLVRKNNTTVIFINQLRDVIGGTGFGAKTTTPGGRALKHYTSIRGSVWNAGQIKIGEIRLGQKVGIKITKNKVAQPYKKTELSLYFDEGLSVAADLIDLAKQFGIIKVSGSWFSMGGIKLGQGLNKVRMAMNEDADLMEDIRKKVLNHNGI